VCSVVGSLVASLSQISDLVHKVAQFDTYGMLRIQCRHMNFYIFVMSEVSLGALEAEPTFCELCMKRGIAWCC
jgi:hypothetical protein